MKKPGAVSRPGAHFVSFNFPNDRFGDSCKRKPKLDTLRAVPQRAQHGLSCPLSEVKQPRIARNEPFGF
jgi:hypothetical protein